MGIKVDQARLADVERVAAVLGMSVTDAVMEALDEYLTKMKCDLFFRLCADIEDAPGEETQEILAEICALTEDDLEIVSVSHFVV